MLLLAILFLAMGIAAPVLSVPAADIVPTDVAWAYPDEPCGPEQDGKYVEEEGYVYKCELDEDSGEYRWHLKGYMPSDPFLDDTDTLPDTS